VRSVSRLSSIAGRPLTRVAVLVACLALLGAGVGGCETTQEKAAKQQARAAHILAARAERQQRKKRQKAHAKAKKHHEGESK
jgi:uncharacterized protein HemX